MVAFENREINEIDMWLFPSLLSKEEEEWLMEQVERLSIFEEDLDG